MSSTRYDRGPIWARPEPGERQPSLTRARIADAALAIADREGFAAVSMRRIATELGVGTMTLYHYVRTKDDLVALMDDALMKEVLVPADSLPYDWRAALSEIARRTRAIFTRHPWALQAMRGAPPGPNGMRHFEQCLAAVASMPLDRASKLDLLSLVDDFVFGHALRTADARAARARPGDDPAFIAYARRQLETGDYPHTAALFSHADPRKASTEVFGLDRDEERFEQGLAALLDGAALRMRRANQPSNQRGPAKKPRRKSAR
jgi:AcrR family transcriptional regulator